MERDDLLQQFPAQRKRLVASLSRLVGAADAEDLAEETLLRALAAVDSFRGEAALGTWLHRIGVNLAYDLLRRRGRDPVLAPEHGVEAAEAACENSDEGLEKKQMSECVQDLLAKLPARQRQVLVQADVLDLTAAEIARDEGISAGNAKIRLHRARLALKQVVEAHCDLHHCEAGVLCCTPKVER
jgi:RNA polymerase sigma-70 factor (ECF subfamily)